MTLQTRQIALLYHLNDENNVFSMANQSREAYNEHYEYWKPYAVINSWLRAWFVHGLCKCQMECTRLLLNDSLSAN